MPKRSDRKTLGEELQTFAKISTSLLTDAEIEDRLPTIRRFASEAHGTDVVATADIRWLVDRAISRLDRDHPAPTMKALRALFGLTPESLPFEGLGDRQGLAANALAISTDTFLKKKYRPLLREVAASLLTFIEEGPAVVRLPHPVRPFVGRNGDLEQIESLLADSGSAVRRPRIQVVTGPPGIGKSAVCLEYGHRVKNRFDTVWNVEAHDDVVATAGLEDLRQALIGRLAASADTSLEHLLKANGSWFLIFDNPTTHSEVLASVPVFGDGCVLIATRDASTPPMGTRFGSARSTRKHRRS